MKNHHPNNGASTHPANGSTSSYQWIINGASTSFYQWIINEKSSSYQWSINIILLMDQHHPTNVSSMNHHHTINGSSKNNHHPINGASTSSCQWIINEASWSYHITSLSYKWIVIILPMDHHFFKSMNHHFSHHIKSSSTAPKLTEADVRTFIKYGKTYHISS